MSEVQTSTGGGPARRTGTGAYGKRPAPEPRVLVVGHLSEDRTPRDRTPRDRTPRDRTSEGPRLGGAAAYAGLLLHRWGAPTEILTAADPAFPFLDALAGIPLTRLDSTTRTVFENRYRADGSREQRLLSRAAPLPEEALAKAVAALPPGSAVLYAPIADELPGSGPLPRPLPRPAGAGSFAGAIPQGMLRRADPASGRVTLAAPADLSRRLSGLDLVCLGEEEARVAGIRTAPARAPGRRNLAQAPRPLLAVTKGAAGALLFGPSPSDPAEAETPPLLVPAFPAKAMDPTGAGDVFAAALLFGLWRGEAPDCAARLAAAAAALTVEAPGVTGIPRRAEAAARRFRGRGARSRPGSPGPR